MKRFEIMIATDRGEKKVSVCVSNEVALMLQACPKGIRIMYLKDEYEEQLHQRKETRRHICNLGSSTLPCSRCCRACNRIKSGERSEI